MYGTQIASIAVGSGGVSSLSFTSIPNTYTDLIIVLSGRVSGFGNNILNFNGSGSGFTNKSIYGYGNGTTGTGTGTTETGFSGTSSDQANMFGAMIFHIPNYTNATNKPYSIDVTDASFNGGYVFAIAGSWANTAAISSITITPPSSGTFVQNTNCYLYGITKGSGGATVS